MHKPGTEVQKTSSKKTKEIYMYTTVCLLCMGTLNHITVGHGGNFFHDGKLMEDRDVSNQSRMGRSG